MKFVSLGFLFDILCYLSKTILKVFFFYSLKVNTTIFDFFTSLDESISILFHKIRDFIMFLNGFYINLSTFLSPLSSKLNEKVEKKYKTKQQ